MRGDDDIEMAESSASARQEEPLLLQTLDPTAEPQLSGLEPISQSTTKRHSTAHLDGLRGLAAFCVFLQHYFAGFALMNVHNYGFLENGTTFFCTLPFIRLLYTGGHSAVVVFFILSGYVLSIGPLSKLKRGDGSADTNGAVRKGLAGAVVRRPFRLYLPPAVVTFIMALLVQVPGPLVTSYAMNNLQDNVWAELKQWWDGLSFNFTPWQYHDNDGLLLHYDLVVWTLPIELNGSMWIYGVMLVGSFFLTASRTRAAIFAGILWVIVVVMLQAAIKWSGVAFTMGIILAMMDTWSLDTYGFAASVSKRTRSIFHHVQLVVGLYLLSQPTSSYQGSLSTPGWGWLTAMTPDGYQQGRPTDPGHGGQYYRYWGCWGAFMVVYATLRLKWLQDFFSRRSLRYLGKVSFMLYLIHMPWMRILLDRWHEALGGLDNPFGAERTLWYQDLLWVPDMGPLGLNTRWLAALTLAIPSSLLIAELATRYIDQPSIALAEKVASLVGLGREKKASRDAEKPILPS